jgi:hypothetical protein
MMVVHAKPIVALAFVGEDIIFPKKQTALFILIIGRCADLGYCKSTTKNGIVVYLQ